MSAIPGQFPGEEEYNSNQQQQATMEMGQQGGNAQASRYQRYVRCAATATMTVTASYSYSYNDLEYALLAKYTTNDKQTVQ